MLSSSASEGNGFYLDGESPNPLPVRISLLDTSLRFMPLNEKRTQNWDFAEIDWEGTRTVNDQLRIKRRDADQWLVVSAPALIGEIQAERKHWTRRHFWSVLPDTGMAIRAGIGTVVICAGLWLGWPLLTEPAVRLVPQSTRDWLGDSAQQLTGMSKLCDGNAGITALNNLTRRLTVNHPELRHIRVVPVQSGMINALTLANDKILLTSAIIAQASGPDEMAGILAHEFGHVARHHVLRGFLGQAAMKALIMVFTGAHGGEINTVNNLASSAHTRKFEAEADAIGLSLLRDAHISSQGLAEFFRRIAKMEGVHSRFTQYFASHPASAEREKMMLETEVPDPTPAMTADEWYGVKNVCRAEPAEEEAAPEDEPEPDMEMPTNPAMPNEREISPHADPDEQREL